MIPRPVLAGWRRRSPWRDDRQVEQDLLQSILAIQLARHPLAGQTLAWRGGTCLHKLHLQTPRRYSEDLDYVLIEEAAHGDVAAALTEVIDAVELEVVRSQVSQTRVSVWAAAPADSPGGRITIKLEVNCCDASPVMDTIRIGHEVDTRWWSGRADVLTFQPAELIGTKFRALAQRRKGRDLSDLWLARQQLLDSDTALAVAADHYLARVDITPAQFCASVAAHLRDPDFTADLESLMAVPYAGYDPQVAGRELIAWSDTHLSPLADTRRNPNAIRREQQRWAKEGGWEPGKTRCVEYDISDGNLTRCTHWIDPTDVCAKHGTANPPTP